MRRKQSESTAGRAAPKTTALRGPVLTFHGDPFQDGLEATMRLEPDAVLDNA